MDMTNGTAAGETRVIDLAEDDRWRDLFYGEPDKDLLQEFARYLRAERASLIRLYHGTAEHVRVAEQGLLPTSPGRRRSAQSGVGYVYLSVYPDMAKLFAELGYPRQRVVVYEVTLPVARLLADKDQLRNQRLWAGRSVGDSLAESLVFGHGARVRGRIEPAAVRVRADAKPGGADRVAPRSEASRRPRL